jgi:hypothetical protein
MKRRDFVKSRLVSLTTVATVGPTAFSRSGGSGHYSEGEKIALSNRYLDWDLLVGDGKLKSVGFRNKLSGRYFELRDSKEVHHYTFPISS